MTKQRQRKSLNCGQLYHPDPRNLRHQRYCSSPAGHKASKAASQARWLSKRQNRNYFRGPEKDYNFKPVVLMQFHAVDSSFLDYRCSTSKAALTLSAARSHCRTLG